MKNGLKKILHYLRMYGFSRTLIKVAGRTRWDFLHYFYKGTYVYHKKFVSLIGCGQFGFSTISYFLQKKKGNIFLECYDIDSRAAKSTSKFWGFKQVSDVHNLIANEKCQIVYIASNHYTHTIYSKEALNAGKIVYSEKPISVTLEQLGELIQTLNNSNGIIYAGYNRPYSKAIQQLNKLLINKKKPMTIGCFITGHKIGLDHWYRNPNEGTRVCGNIGHWLDLTIYLFHKRGYIPTKFNIHIIHSESDEVDDNLTICYSTDYGDLVTITLTSREEPFEGINETINLQCENIISKIDDFRSQQIWNGTTKNKYKYSPKDVGHKRAILQPFKSDNRDFHEVIFSSLLMLKVKEMVLNHINILDYDMSEDIKYLENKFLDGKSIINMKL